MTKVNLFKRNKQAKPPKPKDPMTLFCEEAEQLGMNPEISIPYDSVTLHVGLVNYCLSTYSILEWKAEPIELARMIYKTMMAMAVKEMMHNVHQKVFKDYEGQSTPDRYTDTSSWTLREVPREGDILRIQDQLLQE